MHFKAISIVGSIALLCASCASLRQADDIDVAVVNVQLAGATVWETTAQFTVRLSNQSPEPWILDGSVYKFYLNGTYIGDGMSNERLDVPRLASVTQGVTVHLRNWSLASRIRPILESRTIDYRVKSTLYVLDQQRSRRVNLEREGRLSLEALQPAAGPSENR
jgi:LEA14-like dessication related protein